MEIKGTPLRELHLLACFMLRPNAPTTPYTLLRIKRGRDSVVIGTPVGRQLMYERFERRHARVCILQIKRGRERGCERNSSRQTTMCEIRHARVCICRSCALPSWRHPLPRRRPSSSCSASPSPPAVEGKNKLTPTKKKDISAFRKGHGYSSAHPNVDFVLEDLGRQLFQDQIRNTSITHERAQPQKQLLSQRQNDDRKQKRNRRRLS